MPLDRIIRLRSIFFASIRDGYAMSTAYIEDTNSSAATVMKRIDPECGLLAEPAATLPEKPSIDFPVNARGLALTILATVAFKKTQQKTQKKQKPKKNNKLASY